MSSPIMVTIRAESFITGVITITGVLDGSMFAVISNPAKILPQASRLIGFITCVGVSSIGERGAIRVLFKDTKKISRML